MQPSADSLQTAVQALRAGGVIAYPTEAVWGLGCDPFCEQAVLRLLQLKQRDVAKGLILVAANTAQILPLLAQLDETQRHTVLASWPGPVTWVVPVGDNVPAWVRGSHDSVAVRVSAHTGVQALCHAFGGPLISTSANRAGAAPMDADILHREWGTALDFILPGVLGGDQQPSEIRDACTGVILRAR